MTRTLAVLALLATVAHAEPIAGGLVLARPVAAGAPAPLHDWQAEEDPFRRCAMKALSGHYGKLKPWQEKGYRYGLAQGVTIQGSVWLTSYYPQEGFWRGKGCRSGWPVDERCAAVCRNEWRKYEDWFVWTPWGIRQIKDTGSNRNLGRAERRGASRWIDYWQPYPKGDVVTVYAFIRTY